MDILAELEGTKGGGSIGSPSARIFLSHCGVSETTDPRPSLRGAATADDARLAIVRRCNGGGRVASGMGGAIDSDNTRCLECFGDRLGGEGLATTAGVATSFDEGDSDIASTWSATSDATCDVGTAFSWHVQICETTGSAAADFRIVTSSMPYSSGGDSSGGDSRGRVMGSVVGVGGVMIRETASTLVSIESGEIWLFYQQQCEKLQNATFTMATASSSTEVNTGADVASSRDSAGTGVTTTAGISENSSEGRFGATTESTACSTAVNASPSSVGCDSSGGDRTKVSSSSSSPSTTSSSSANRLLGVSHIGAGTNSSIICAPIPLSLRFLRSVRILRESSENSALLRMGERRSLVDAVETMDEAGVEAVSDGAVEE